MITAHPSTSGSDWTWTLDVEKPIFTKGKEKTSDWMLSLYLHVLVCLAVDFRFFLSPGTQNKHGPCSPTVHCSVFISLAGHSRTFRAVLRTGNVYYDPLPESESTHRSPSLGGVSAFDPSHPSIEAGGTRGGTTIGRHAGNSLEQCTPRVSPTHVHRLRPHRCLRMIRYR